MKSAVLVDVFSGRETGMERKNRIKERQLMKLTDKCFKDGKTENPCQG
jgi:hypothetical protein